MPNRLVLLLIAILALPLAGCGGPKPPARRIHVDSMEAVVEAWRINVAILDDASVLAPATPAPGAPSWVPPDAARLMAPMALECLALPRAAPERLARLVDGFQQSNLLSWNIQMAIEGMLGVLPEGVQRPNLARDTQRSVLERHVEALPEAIRDTTLTLTAAMLDAAYAVETALAGLTPDDRQLIRENALAFLDGTLDPQRARRIVALYRRVNMPLMAQAAYRLSNAATEAALDYAEFAQSGQAGNIDFDRQTPIGRVVIAGTGNTVHRGDAALVVDLGGDNTYVGSAGSSYWADRPVALVIDVGGNDRYEPARYFGIASGVLGIGMVVDMGGDDTWGRGDGRGTQGFGFFGIGILADLGGSDTYRAHSDAQGAGAFGLGMLFDGAGSDTYEARRRAQGVGFLAGAGLLLDRGGDDAFRVTADISPEPGSANNAADATQPADIQRSATEPRGHLSQAQGAAIAPVWPAAMPAGFGLLVNLGGNNMYEAASCAQGYAERLGIGALVNTGGSDVYSAATHAQALARDGGVALLIDTSGDDQYTMDTLGQATALGRSVAVLYSGAGNDFFRAAERTRGFGSDIGAFAVFVNNAGDDYYEYKLDTVPSLLATHPPQAPGNTRAFVDLGGHDTYLGGITAFGPRGTLRLDPEKLPFRNNIRHRHSGGALFADLRQDAWSRLDALVEGLPEEPGDDDEDSERDD